MEAAPPGRGRSRVGLDLLLLGTLAATAYIFWELNIIRSGYALWSLPNFDLYSEFFPRHSFAAAALRQGRIPLWDPHQIAGLPFLATFQAGVLYPPNLLYTILPIGTAMGILALLHVVLAGFFMFLLCRELRRSRAASWLAALTFMLGGSTLWAIFHTNAINSVPWLPAALYCTSRLGREGNLRWALLLGLCMSLQFLAGRDFTFVMTVHCLWLFVVFQAVWMIQDGLGFRRVGKHVVQVALGAALAAGIVSAQALPTILLAEKSVRPFTGLEPRFIESFSPMPAGFFFANLIDPARGVIRREYFGWIPLVFFLMSFRLWGRDRPAVFSSVLVLLAVLLCLGSQTPLYPAYRWLPLGAVFRLPDRFVFLLSLGLSLGAACGFDRLFNVHGQEDARWRRLAPNALLVLCFGFALALALASGWVERQLVATTVRGGWLSFYGMWIEHFSGMRLAPAYFAAAAALLLLCAWRAGRKGSRALVFTVLILAVVDLNVALRNPFFHPARDSRSVVSAAPCYEKVPAIAGEHGRHLTFRMADGYALKDKDGELFSTYSATHYEPLVTRRQAAYFSVLQEGGAQMSEDPLPLEAKTPFMGFLKRFPTRERFKLLDLLGTGVILVDGRPEKRSSALSAFLSSFRRRDRCQVVTDKGHAPVDLYENPNALPRAFIVQKVSGASSPEEALRRLVEPRFDPRREAVVEPDVPPLGFTNANGGTKTARIVSYGDTRVVVRAETSQPGLLVLTDTYDEDWSATLNGERVRIFPTDGLFRGVPLPAGESEIVFRYRPWAFYGGAAVSVCAAVLWMFLWVRSRRPAA
jgi:hypothetical protein